MKSAEHSVGAGQPRVFGAHEAARVMPVVSAEANKYSRGKLAVFGGSARFPAAPVMAALAAPRAGAGYTVLCVPQSAAACAHLHLLSTAVAALPEDDGCLCAASAEAARGALASAAAFVAGPGLDRSPAAGEFLLAFLAGDEARARCGVVDADALTLVAHDKEAFLAAREAAAPVVLTPHHGEASHLLGGRKVNDPAFDACELASAYACVVVLKGPNTYVANPDGEVCVIVDGGPELAKAGSGDVLSGIVGALLAQGVEVFDAACLGVWLHARAGALAALELGVASVMPEDLPLYVARAIRSLEPLSPKLAKAQADASCRAGCSS